LFSAILFFSIISIIIISISIIIQLDVLIFYTICCSI